jgi:thymidylate kinase
MLATIVCIEGPSAVGKTTLGMALAKRVGGFVVPEVSGTQPPGESAAWFVDEHAKRWREARESAARVPLVVLDGDPFKGLWYNWIYAAEGWAGIEVVAPLYRAELRSGDIGFPDLYVVLQATAATLRSRRMRDATRRRSSFEKHLAMLEPLDRYFDELSVRAPARVVKVETDDRTPGDLVEIVLKEVERLVPPKIDPIRLLDSMADWVAAGARRL